MEQRIRGAIAALRARSREDVKAAAMERSGEIVRWRRTPSADDPHDPRPWAVQRGGRDAYWPDENGQVDGMWVGLDAAGRPVRLEERWKRASTVRQYWDHGDDWIDYVGWDGFQRRILFADGHAVAVVETRDDGDMSVERWTLTDGVPVRGEIASVWEGGHSATVYVAALEGNELRTLSREHQFMGDRAGRADGELFEAAWSHAATLGGGGAVVYDAKVDRYEPVLRPSADLLALLPGAIEDALVAAVADAGVVDPFVVDLRVQGHTAFRLFGRVGGAAFRKRMTGLSPEPGAAVESLYKAEPPLGKTFDLAPYLDDDAARACRELDAAWHREAAGEPPERRRGIGVIHQLERDLSARLNAREWSGAAEPFLALVRLGTEDTRRSPYELAAETAGADRVAAFRASIASRRKPRAKPSAEAGADRAALETLLAQRGLPTHAHRLAHDCAQLGLRVRAAGDTAVRSRLGGPPLLPPGAAWPHDADDRPLTFLAGIDLAELPPSDALPAAGWMLYFADLDNDDAEGLVEEEENEEGAKARLFVLPAGTDPVEGVAPDALAVRLVDRPVSFQAQLTLPDGYEDAEALGLDAAEAEAYGAVAGWLRVGDDPDEPLADHWILGAVTGAQGHSSEEDTELLLHLASDGDLGFAFLDGGVIQFRIPATALAAGDWSAAVALPDSG